MTNPKLPGREAPTPGFAWSNVRRRLDAAVTLLERGWAPSPEERKAILKARAKALAQEPSTAQEPEDSLGVVEFSLAHERYAIESSYVREVCPLKDLTPLPGTPPFVLGIINVRGQIFSVIELKKLFDLPEKGLSDLNKVIVVGHGPMAVGILADLVVGVRSIRLRDIQASLPTLTGIRAEYLRGVTRDPVVILDPEKLLSHIRVVEQEETESLVKKGN